MNVLASHSSLRDYNSYSDGLPKVPLRVHLTHACPIVRAGLASILSACPELTVDDAVDCNDEVGHTSVLITDYVTGLELARDPTFQNSSHPPQILVLTTHSKEWEVRQAIDQGIKGYLLQGCSPDELLRCVYVLGRGASYLSATATRSVVDSLGRIALTRRELDVLYELAKGGSDKHIARQLCIGPGTVKSHLKHLLSKLGASARTHAVVVAIERGLLSERCDERPRYPSGDVVGVGNTPAEMAKKLQVRSHLAVPKLPSGVKVPESWPIPTNELFSTKSTTRL